MSVNKAKTKPKSLKK